MAFKRDILASLLRFDFKRQQLMAVAISFILLVFLSLAILTGFRAWKGYQIQLKDAAVTTANMARALAQHTEDALKTTDVLLLNLVERAEAEGKNPASLARLQNIFRMQVSGLPQLHALFYFDQSGRYIASSQASLPSIINNSDREYFKFHQTHLDAGSYIGPPVRSRTTGDWIITVSRRVNHEDGGFGGVMLATIHMNYFRDFHTSLNLGKKGIIFIANRDGVLLTRHPFLENIVGKRAKNGLFDSGLFSAKPAGTFMRKSAMDGHERLYSYRYLERYPLIAAAALSEEDIFSRWFSELYTDLDLLGLLALLLSLLGYRLVKQVKMSLNAETSLLESQNSLQLLNHTFQKLAMQDSLTGLANRRQFDTSLQNELNRAVRLRIPTSVLMLDVDCFKQYNDTYGHLAGDECLKAIGKAIGKVLYRTGDLAARYGGEEFTVLLPNADTDGAVAIADRIRISVRDLGIEHKRNAGGFVTISIGVSTLNQFNQKCTPRDLTESADRALYQAKAKGRNCVHDDRDETAPETARNVI